jgi:predicted aminopeptidase
MLPMMNRSGFTLILAVCALLTACESTSYYAQAVGGHAGILRSRKPIETVIESDETPAEVKTQLRKILELREFAETSLALPLKDQYGTYVELDSDYAVWNIFAAPELSLEPRLWCYPVVGCAGFRGYKHPQDSRGDIKKHRKKR